ncbi:MAG: acetyl-CoA carboxylase, carboxyltransferase subunit beta [Armatimonadetes bacterium]|nr:acetyl-CoA carboxylase, carboxyltransferase subunit beta [Armatimonadota bacterium]
MASFFRRQPKASKEHEIPADLWEECPGCRQLVYGKELESELWVCNKCGFHFRLTVWQRLQITADPGTFIEWDRELPIHDPLEFPDYRAKLEEARAKTGMTEAILTGTCAIERIPIGIGLMDLSFVGGSMGWAVGERVARLMERSAEEGMGVVVFCASGGARMQESLVALMQMAKTSGAAGRLAAAGLPYISVLTHPTYGGVTASYAFLGDVILAEPGAAVGFAGPRVIEVTNLKMPPGVQTVEFQYQHGMVDLLVPRKEMRETLGRILRWCTENGRE